MVCHRKKCSKASKKCGSTLKMRRVPSDRFVLIIIIPQAGNFFNCFSNIINDYFDDENMLEMARAICYNKEKVALILANKYIRRKQNGKIRGLKKTYRLRSCCCRSRHQCPGPQCRTSSVSLHRRDSSFGRSRSCSQWQHRYP